MDEVRYFFAVLLVISIPPALLMWFLVHPFIGFWRRFHAAVTLTVMLAMIGMGMFALFSVRTFLVSSDLGSEWVLMVIAALLLVPTIRLALARKKHLTMRILSGIPEFQGAEGGGVLLTEGVYSKIRHPRYIEVILGTISYALFANYLGAYVIAVLTVPGIHAIVLLEERELLARFGDEYVRYKAAVPRYLPRRGPS